MSKLKVRQRMSELVANKKQNKEKMEKKNKNLRNWYIFWNHLNKQN